MRISRSPRCAFVLTVLLAGCGVQGRSVEVPPTRPTLFAPTYTAAPTTAAPIGSPPPRLTTTTTTAPPRPLPTVVADGVPRAVVTPTGVVAAVTAVRADGSFEVVSPCGNDVAVARAIPVVGVNVVLDPGHGGVDDPGQVGPAGTKESDVNLAVAQAVKERLEAVGVKVLLTRTTDSFVTLSSRARIATSLAPDAFVSIHHNGAPDHTEDRPGTEVYYQADDEPRSGRLAGLIHEEVTEALAAQRISWGWFTDAGVKVRLNDRGLDYYGILRNATGVPTALAELSYLTNAPEEALLRTDAFRQVEAAAVARAIVRFLTTDDPGTGFVGPSTRPAVAVAAAPACVDPPLE